jgi:hypothetical protein
MALDRTCPACDEDSMNCDATAKGTTLATIALIAGYHRFFNTTDVPYIKECPYFDSCEGGMAVGDASCRNGSKGPLCAVCDADYFMSELSGECIECGKWTDPLTNAAVLFGVAIVCCIGLRRQQLNIAKVLNAMDHKLRSHLQFALRTSIMPKIKIGVPFISMLGVMGWVYGADELFAFNEACSERRNAARRLGPGPCRKR